MSEFRRKDEVSNNSSLKTEPAKESNKLENRSIDKKPNNELKKIDRICETAKDSNREVEYK
jgi:hypothetical protein